MTFTSALMPLTQHDQRKHHLPHDSQEPPPTTPDAPQTIQPAATEDAPARSWLPLFWWTLVVFAGLAAGSGLVLLLTDPDLVHEAFTVFLRETVPQRYQHMVADTADPTDSSTADGKAAGKTTATGKKASEKKKEVRLDKTKTAVEKPKKHKSVRPEVSVQPTKKQQAAKKAAGKPPIATAVRKTAAECHTECPLCVEPLDSTDKALKPCDCGYCVCLFCYVSLTQCPHCRAQYGEKPDTASQALAQEKAAAEQAAAAEKAAQKLAAAEKAAVEKAAAEKTAAEKAAAEKAATAKVEEEAAAEKAAQEVAAEKAAQEVAQVDSATAEMADPAEAADEQAAVEIAAAEKATQDNEALEEARAAKEKAAAEKATAEDAAAEKAAIQKAAAEKAAAAEAAAAAEKAAIEKVKMGVRAAAEERAAQVEAVRQQALWDAAVKATELKEAAEAAAAQAAEAAAGAIAAAESPSPLAVASSEAPAPTSSFAPLEITACPESLSPCASPEMLDAINSGDPIQVKRLLIKQAAPTASKQTVQDKTKTSPGSSPVSSVDWDCVECGASCMSYETKCWRCNESIPSPEILASANAEKKLLQQSASDIASVRAVRQALIWQVASTRAESPPKDAAPDRCSQCHLLLGLEDSEFTNAADSADAEDSADFWSR